MEPKRKNLQSEQKGIQYWPDDNGWNEPLADPSDRVKVNVTDGKSGSISSANVSTYVREAKHTTDADDSSHHE